METQTATTEPRVWAETFLTTQRETRYRIVVDGKVIDDLDGKGWRSPEKALNYWDSKNGLQGIVAERKAERRNAFLAQKAASDALKATFEVAKEEARKKILVLLDQHPVWNAEELQTLLGVTDRIFTSALHELPQVEYSNSINTVHKKTKELMILRREARKAVGVYSNTTIEIIPDSNAAPVKTGEPCSDYNLKKYGKYNPSTLLVTVGEHWSSPP